MSRLETVGEVWTFIRENKKWWLLPIIAVLVALGGLLLLIGLTMPRAAALFHRAWMGLAAGLGYVNGRVLLTLIYFFVVFPFGLASRLFGNDPLQRRGGNKDSYWIARARPRQTRQGFERSF